MFGFYHHPDGWIYLNGFQCLLGEFLRYAPAYTLPPGMVARLYTPGRFHVLTDGRNQFTGPMPWEEGDGYLANADATIAAITASRQPPPPTLDQAKAAKIAAVEARTDALLTAGFPFATADGRGAFNFSLRLDIQPTWIGLFNAAMAGLLRYPVPVGTTDEQLAYLTTADDVDAWYAAGTERGAAILGGGAVLKAQMRAATDQAGLDAITDNRT